ncbi:MAG: hypothetical protein R3301_07770 [Saprospiraceae bacterium]|nr:hypothetical protein [Saprospiraceae bacterium]
MKNQEDIRNIRREVDMFFDHALSKEDEQQLLARVENDPTYHRVFSQEKYMREHIKRSIHRPGVTPDLIKAIKDNIRMA